MGFTLVWNGILLGLGAAAPIGPVNVEIARRSLRRGAGAGFALGCGAVTVDVCYALLTGLGVTRLLQGTHVKVAFGIAATAILLYLAISCFISAARDTSVARFTAEPSSTRRHYLTGLLMTASNPMTLAFWLVAVPGVVKNLVGSSAHRWAMPVVCGGVFVGALAWVCLFTGMLAWAGTVRRRGWLVVADLAGGTVLLAFAVFAGWRTLST
jgi:L-lysine exporter family protein LysE/ArgO